MIRFLLLIYLISFSFDATAISSIDITEATMKAASKINSSCFRYHVPIRYCIWYMPYEGTNYTPWLDHYLPDVVVVVYRNANDNPWVEANTLFDKPTFALQEKSIDQVGSGNHSFTNNHEQNVIFKEADVIGNPGLISISHLGKYTLSSTAIPMNPYFQSMTDSLQWRGFMPEALPEETAALALNMTHHLGAGIKDWGGIYPHEGSVMGSDDLQASMVVAERAADLLSYNNRFGHVHQSLSNSCDGHCEATSISENTDDTLFQMIYPKQEDDCAVLGSDQSYRADLISDDGAYAWILWRHYQGCSQGDGVFVGVTP